MQAVLTEFYFIFIQSIALYPLKYEFNPFTVTIITDIFKLFSYHFILGFLPAGVFPSAFFSFFPDF